MMRYVVDHTQNSENSANTKSNALNDLKICELNSRECHLQVRGCGGYVEGGIW